MPATLTYPGVYIEELPSGVHSITGVATSITAFVGWAPQGPTNQATLVESFPDFATQFGGFDSRSYLGYAVSQFFSNGGSQAYIVRLVWDGTQPAAPNTSPAPATTARSVGIGLATAAITAKSGAQSASATLTVGAPVLQSIALTPGALPWLQVGQTQQLTATGTYSDGSMQNLTATAAWTSGSPAATVNNSGLVTAAAPGNAIITATMGAVTVSATIVVSAAVITTIAVTPATPSIAVGNTAQFTATGTYSDGTSQDVTAAATWASATPANATVTSPGGLATGVAAGTSKITASFAGASGNTTLTVTAAVLVSIAVTPNNPPWIQPAATQQFKATGTMSDGTTADLTAAAGTVWASSNNSAVTVSAGGLATAVTAGSVMITATSAGVTGQAKLRVTAATLASIAITPAAPSLAAGLTQQLAAQGTFSDSTTQDLTSFVNYTVTGAAASVSATGLAKALAAGSSTVTAKLGALTSPAITITVTPAALQSLAVTPATPSIASGATQQFKATGTFTDGSTQDLTASSTWSSSNPAVATVSAAGLATAVAAGGTLTLFTKNPGDWGNGLQAAVVAGGPGRFGIQVQLNGQVVESFVNLSITSTDPQYVVTVIDNDSNYITFLNPATNADVVPTATPSATPTKDANGNPLALPFFSGGSAGTPLVPASNGNFETAMTNNPVAGVNLLDRVPIFNLLCVPAETNATTIQTLQGYCAAKRAFYIVDPPQTATVAGLTATGPVGSTPGSLTGSNSPNSAYYFPWVSAPDPLIGNRSRLFPPCGFVAGIYAATDVNPGVWKAPAGILASLSNESGLQFTLTDLENGNLNTQAINCLREFRVYGDVVWGARTLQGNDQAGSQWKYVPIRRLALYIESSLYDGTQWVVFQPNDENLWSLIRMNVGAFMQGLFAKGAFQGTTPQQAYFVKCDSENNPQPSIDLGVVNILVGFAPLYPAEFVVIQIQQMAGQVQS